MSDPEPFGVRVYFDFASSLCYVGHRVMQRLGPFLLELRCELSWVPVDLAHMMRWRRGARVPPERLAHVALVAEALHVPLQVPGVWLDSRDLCAASLMLARRDAASGEQREASWRERVWTAIYEEGRRCADRDELARLATDLGISISSAELDEGREALDQCGREAVESMVTGVPTFMLGPWPFGGIQEDETMRSILQRYADRARGLR